MDTNKWLITVREILTDRYRENPDKDNLTLLMKFSGIACDLHCPMSVDLRENKEK